MPKLQHDKTNDRYFITVPKNMVLEKRWIKGQDLVFIYNARGNIEIGDNVPSGGD